MLTVDVDASDYLIIVGNLHDISILQGEPNAIFGKLCRVDAAPKTRNGRCKQKEIERKRLMRSHYDSMVVASNP